MSVKSTRNASDVSNEQTNRQNDRISRSETASHKRHQVNWHEAACCAIQIELRDYSDLLEYMEEYNIGRNYYRIDLLVVKKLTDQVIPKNIALIFKTFNLFEIKGVGSTAGIDSYYKTIGYAGLLINQTGEKDQYSSIDVSLTILSFHYPIKLIKHLQQDRKLSIEKISPGVYYINKETFNTQIIVTKELPPKDNLYLSCLTDRLHNESLAEKLVDDYEKHWEQDIYDRYMRQLATANRKSKGDGHMVINEWLYEMCGTSSDEVIARAKKESEEYYQPQIDRLSQDNEQLSSDIKQLSSDLKQLSSEIDYLRLLLKQNNIPFNTENASGTN